MFCTRVQFARTRSVWFWFPFTILHGWHKEMSTIKASRSLSEDTASTSEVSGDEWVDEDTVQHTIHVALPARLHNASLLKKYVYAAEEAIRSVKLLQNEVYNFIPVVVAAGVAPECLNDLPTINGYFIKSLVEDGQLLIVELGSGKLHAAGVANLVGQTEVWMRGHGQDDYFAMTTDGNYTTGNKGIAPELVICAGDNYKDELQQHKIGQFVIITFVLWLLDVSHLPCCSHHGAGSFQSFSASHASGLRGGYFNEPSMHSVIGIKLFGTRKL